VRITEFTDVLCDHCADLHRTLASLREHAGAASFSVEPRQFPLDGRCNPMIQRGGESNVRCLAARAQICLEGHERAFEFSGALFANQKSLTEARIYELAQPFASRAALDRCLRDAATEGRLQSDIADASRHELEGTPLVLVNGRKGTSFGPFLYAMILTRGEAAHPAFTGLPAANPDAHVH
jgi:serine/threonine-protein kinase